MTFDEKPSSRVQVAFFLLLAVVAVAAYWNTLSNGFVYDDEYQVLKNPWIKDFGSIPTVFTSEVWGFKGESISNYYRPLLHVVYMVIYRMFGYQAWAYHAVNVLLHAAVTVLVYLLAQAVLSRQNGRYAAVSSLAAAIIFAVHPIHTEVVAPVMSVTDLLLSVFCLSAICLHIRFVDRPWPYELLPAALFGLALLSKEIAVTLPVMLLAYDCLIEKRIAPLSRLAGRYAPYLIVGLAYCIVRWIVLGSFAPINRHPDLSTWQCLLNIFPLAAQYGFKLLVPVNLSAMYDFNPVKSLTETRALLSTGAVLAGAAGSYLVARKSRTVAFGLALTVIPLLPAFYIRSIPYPFAERYLYLPSVGCALIIAGLISKYAHKSAVSRGLAVVLPIVITLYLAGTVMRNRVWKDNYTLWSDTVQKAPNNATVHCNLGDALKARGRIGEAIEQITIATQLAPHTEYFRILGDAYYRAGDRREALKQYEKAVSLEPSNAMAQNNLGSLYGELGDTANAITHLEAAIRQKPGQADSRYNLGMAYRDAGMIGKAAEQFEAAVALNPRDPEYRRSLDEAVRLMGRKP